MLRNIVVLFVVLATALAGKVPSLDIEEFEQWSGRIVGEQTATPGQFPYYFALSQALTTVLLAAPQWQCRVWSIIRPGAEHWLTMIFRWYKLSEMLILFSPTVQPMRIGTTAEIGGGVPAVGAKLRYVQLIFLIL